MQTLNTTFTIAEYCAQMERREIVVNHAYQRSNTVWPPAAQSYLIDTILLGYPVPKLSLAQKTDLKTRRTIKEIVDGQQRSQAIDRFYRGGLRITGRSQFAGRAFDRLDEEEQQRFIEYQLNVDVLVGAGEEDIREVFRRMNSYNVPLNRQEHRHSTFQGAMKWFVVSLSHKYSQTLKNLGILTEHQLSRMDDGQLFSELIHAMLFGVTTSSPTKLANMYKSKDVDFPEEQQLESRFSALFDTLLGWPSTHQTDLMKPYNLYALALAITHSLNPMAVLNGQYPLDRPVKIDQDIALTNLGILADMAEEPDRYPSLAGFAAAGREATNTLKNRIERFKAFCEALRPTPLQ